MSGLLLNSANCYKGNNLRQRGSVHTLCEPVGTCRNLQEPVALAYFGDWFDLNLNLTRSNSGQHLSSRSGVLVWFGLSDRMLMVIFTPIVPCVMTQVETITIPFL